MSLVVRDNIHSGIDLQFPAIYREDGGFMVEFTKAYYKFADERMDRNIPKLKDVDTTLASFLIFFKKKYLADLPLDTVIDTRFIIKHVSDLYKRKGTQESLELLFQLFYNEQIEIYYPSTSILKPSDSVWGGDTFLEMSPVFVVNNYPIQKGDRISGDISAAVAFVDQVIFVNFTGSLTPIVYLSGVVGKFSSDDGITVTRSGVSTTVGKLIAGSISDVSVTEANRIPGQVAGDRLQLVSSRFGVDATASVLSVSASPTGQIDFSIVDGGFGYADPASSSANNAIGISNQVVIVTQASTTAIKPGDIISCDTSPVVSAAGKIYSPTPTPIHGTGLVIAYVHPLVYIKTMDDATRTAKLNETVSSGTYTGQKVILVDMLKTIVGEATLNPDWDIILKDIASNGFAYGDITHTNGLSVQDRNVMESYIDGTLTNAAYIDHIETHMLPALGIYQQFNLFPSSPVTSTGDPIGDSTTTVKLNDLESGTITTIAAYNDSAGFVVSDITDTEYVTLIVDQIGDYSEIPLSSVDYGMSGAGEETINTTLTDAFTPLTVQLGAMSDLLVSSSGTNYENDVYTNAVHSNISKFDKKDVIVQFTDQKFLMQVGDIVTQTRQIEDLAAASQEGNVDPETLSISDLTGSYPSQTTIQLSVGDTIDYVVKARYLKRIGNDYYFRQLSFYDFDSQLPISIVNNDYGIRSIRYDVDSLPMGANAIISGIASYEIGQIETIATVNSGYRYQDGEIVSLLNVEPTSPYYNQVVATSTIRTLGSGSTEGGWKTTTSFLSEASKKLHDNYYYQEYSYEVSSIIDPAKYEPLIRDTIGVAGTKIFSSPLINSINSVEPAIDVEFQVWNISPENLVTEDSNADAILTEDGINIVSELIGLDVEYSATITASIGT